MTDNGWLERSKVKDSEVFKPALRSWLFLLLISGVVFGENFLGCASPSVNQSPPESPLTAGPLPASALPLPRQAPTPTLTQEEVRFELSSPQVAAGALILVTLKIPEGKYADFSGEFEGISFDFFAAPDLGAGIYEAVLGIPYERKPGPGEIKVQGAVSLNIPINIIDGQYPSESLHVDGRRVHPTKKKDLLRIKRELVEVAEIYKTVTRQKFWTGPFQLPIDSVVTSPFGGKRVYNGTLKNYHSGLDLRAPMNTPVYSAAPGKVVLAKNLFFTGNTVMLDHGYGVITLYAHMNELRVKKGDLVEKHTLLGLSGKTGRVNGPHLHWQAVVHHVKVNPLGLTSVIR